MNVASSEAVESASFDEASQRSRIRERCRTQLWPIGLLYSVLAVAATMSSAWGSYIGDNRYEQYVNPARRLAKSFGVWDPTRGLGAPREDVWFGTTIPGAVFRGLGLAPWVGERLFHALCLVTMALGVTALLKLFRPRIGAEHLIAGLYAAFGPYSAAFLVPTNLYYMMALGPWLVVAMVRGLTEDRPWRWAAMFALMVAWAGNPDPPGLIYNAIILIVTALYLVHVERAVRWRDVAKWAAAMGALALACSAWALLKTYFARDMLNARLVDTELPSVSALTSSWSESIRGLGNWLSYFTISNGLVKPQGQAHFLRWWVVLADFIVPLVALVALWRVRWRAKVLFAAMAFVSAAVIVGGFASPGASPLGAGILWVMENITVISSFRNTYKAGGGLAIGIGVLAGVGVVAASRAVQHRGRWIRRAPALATAAVLLTVSFPFWTGNLYHPFQRVAAVPTYWSEAFDYLDHLPDPGLTAVVPAITRASYRWGWVGDDIFDALLARPHAISTGVPLSNPLGANALEAFTLAAQSVPYRPGEVGALARRLGITEIVVRNDLTWESLGLPRPSSFDGLRNDPDFELAATFGEVGVGVVGFRDRANPAIRERRLTPVEVYRVRDPGSLVRSVSGSGVVVAGDANSWPLLQTSGLVAPSTPLETSGAVTDAAIGDELRSASGVVITDTARRRLRTLLDYEPAYSATLGLQQEAGRVVREEFPDNVTAQSTVWIPDAESISTVGFTFSQIPVSLRPSNAFDGDLETQWGVKWVLTNEVPGVEVKLRSPHVVADFDIAALLSSEGLPSVRRVSVTLADGTQRQAFTDDVGRAMVRFPPTSTTSFVIRLEGVVREQGLVGLREVAVAGLDLREFIQSPTDLFGTRDGGDRLDQVMKSLPTAYAFSRSTRTTYLAAGGIASGRLDEDQTIRRRFDIARPDAYHLDGVLRRSPALSAENLTSLLPAAVTATATASDPAGLVGLPADAIDGSLTSPWIATRPLGEALTLHVPQQRVQRVEVVMQLNGQAVGASLMTATIEGSSVSVSAVADASCPPFLLSDIKEQAEAGTQPSTVPCYRRAVFNFVDPVSTDTVKLELSAYDKRVNRFGIKWFVNEVNISGPDRDAADNKVDRTAKVGGDCVDVGLRVADAAVPVSFHSTVGELLDGAGLAYSACSPVQLRSSSATLESGSRGLVESVVLRTSDWPAEPTPDRPEVAAFVTSDRAVADVSLDSGGLVVFGQSFDPLWKLSIDGAPAGAVVPMNGLNAWRMPAGVHHLVIGYQPERLLIIGISVTLAAIALCGLLIFAPSRRATLVDLSGWDFHRPSRRASYAAVAVGTLVGSLLVGPLALVVGLAVALVVRYAEEPVELTGASAPALLLIAAFASVAPLLIQTQKLSLGYAKERPWAHQATLVAIVFAVQTVALLTVAARTRSSALPRPLGRPWGSMRMWLATSWQLVAAGALAVTVHIAAISLSPDASGVDGLLRNIRMGSKYSVDALAGEPAVDFAPFALVVRAMTRLPRWVLGGLVLAAICAVVVQWARRKAPLVPSWWLVVAVAVSPLSWGVALGGQIAVLAVLSAALLFEAGHRRPGSLVTVGVLLGVATLARPDAVLLGVVSLVIVAVRYGRAPTAWMLLGLVMTASPWLTFCWSAGTAPWMASSASAMVLDGSVTGVAHWLPWWWSLAATLLVVTVAARRRAQAPASR